MFKSRRYADDQLAKIMAPFYSALSDDGPTNAPAALTAAMPHLTPQPAELAQSPAGHELAYAVEKALGNRGGKRDAELDELLEMAMHELNAIDTNLPAELVEQQGDARAQFEAWALGEFFSLHRYDSGPYSHDRTFSAWLAWQAAPAARQPGASNQVVEEIEQLAVDTHPGTQGPRAWLIHWPHNGGQPEATTSASRVEAVGSLTNAPRIEALHAAPPAQGIDLGRLPRAVELMQGVSRTLVDWAADDQREAINIVKALIVGKRDAAPGVGQ